MRRVQVGQQFGAKALAMQNSRDVYSTIPKSREWLTINCVVNVTGVALPTFHILKGSRMQKRLHKVMKSRNMHGKA